MRKKTIMITPIHSFVDVITNSSSELFVSCEAKCSNTIKNIIINILKKRNYEEKDFDSMFGEISILNEDNMPEIIDNIFCFGGNYQQDHPFLKELFPVDPIIKKLLEEFKVERSPSFKHEQEFKKSLNNKLHKSPSEQTIKNWEKKWRQYVRKNARNSCLYHSVYFTSKGDNTIPWEIVEDIEEILPCLRIHIG